MFRFDQRTGLTTHNGQILGECYSGHDVGVNNPVLQQVKNVGPLPRGLYRILASRCHPTLGPLAMPLIPHPENEMFGRSAFYVHGDNRKNDKSASEGCVIAGLAIRQYIAKYQPTDDVLEVFTS